MTGNPEAAMRPITLAPDFLDADFLDFDIQYGVNLRLKPEVKENYKKTFRLTLDNRGPGFVDATGAWHPIPEETALVAKRTITGFFPGIDARTDIQHVLIFSDAHGTTLLRLPSYGWPMYELQEFCSQAGWDTDFSNERIRMEDSWKLFKGISRSHIAPVEGPLRDGRILVTIADRLAARFKKSKQQKL